MGELLGANAPDCLNEILDGSSKVIVGSGGWYGNRVVWHPLNGLSHSLSIGGNVPDSIATVVVETGSKVSSVACGSHDLR